MNETGPSIKPEAEAVAEAEAEVKPAAPASPKKKRKDKPFAARTIARAWALQTAYAWHQQGGMAEQGEPVDGVVETLPIETPPEDEDDPEGIVTLDDPEIETFARCLAASAFSEAAALDELLRPCLHNWRLDRLALIDHILLRLAIAELRLFPETPYKVVLNEYIELAKDFGSPETPRFVNGVLDNLARRLRPDEVGPKDASPKEPTLTDAPPENTDPPGHTEESAE